jgi:hypothetical protein
MTFADDLTQAGAALTMIQPKPFNAETPIGITLRPTEPSVSSTPDWRLAAAVCWQT